MANEDVIQAMMARPAWMDEVDPDVELQGTRYVVRRLLRVAPVAVVAQIGRETNEAGKRRKEAGRADQGSPLVVAAGWAAAELARRREAADGHAT